MKLFSTTATSFTSMRKTSKTLALTVVLFYSFFHLFPKAIAYSQVTLVVVVVVV